MEPTPDSSKLEDHGSFVERVDSPPSAPKPDTQQLNAKLANPLAGVPHEKLMADAAIFAGMHDLAEYTETIQKGALVAQDPAAFESLPMLTEEDRVMLRREITHKWDQPAMLYYLVIMCSLAAAVQGVRRRLLLLEDAHILRLFYCYQMDEAVANGANLFFPKQFGIDPGPPGSGMNKNQWLQGLVTSAPYVSLWSFYPLVNCMLKYLKHSYVARS